MKKIVSLILALTMLVGMCAYAAEPTGYTESGMSFETVFTVTNTNSIPGRMFQTAVYQTNGKSFVYVGTNSMIAVYDVTDGIPTLIEQISGFFSDSIYPMTVYDGALYYSNGGGSLSKATYKFPIGSDGKLGIDTTNLTQYRIAAGYVTKCSIYIDEDYIIGTDTSNRIYAAKTASPANVAASKTISTVRWSETVKLSNGNYRIICLTQTSVNTDTLAVYDYNPADNSFTEVVKQTVWESGNTATANDMMVIDENTVIANFKNTNSSPSYIRRIDFTDNLETNAVTSTDLAQHANASTAIYGHHFSRYDENTVIAWGPKTLVYDISGNNWTVKAEYNWNGARVCADANIDNTYYIAGDGTMKAIKVEAKRLIEYTVDRVKNCIINPGETVISDIDIDARAIAAYEAGGKSIVYARDYGTGQIYAYNVTDPGAPEVMKIYDFGLAASSAVPMNVYNGHLLVADTKYIYAIPIAEDGSLGEKKTVVTESANVTQFELVDTTLTVGTSSKITMYDVSNLAGADVMGVVLNAGYRYFAVEKATSHSYRVYIIQAATTQAGNGTLNFNITEVRKGLGGVTVTTKFNGIPDLSTLNVWPSYGIYGEDETVEGYIGLKPMNFGKIYMAGENTVRVVMGTSTTNATLSNGDIIVDCKDVTNPKAASCTELCGSVANACVYQAKIDDYSAIEVPQYGYNNGQANEYSIARIKNYSNPEKVKTTANIRNLSGTCVAVAGNMAYSTDRSKKLRAVKLYDELTEFTVSPISVTDNNGNAVSDVSPGILTASAEVYNPDSAREAVMVMSMYDTFTDELNYTQLKTVSVPTGYSEITDTIDMEQLDNYSAYTKYLRVFIWDGMNTAVPLTKSVKVSAVTVEGTSFDIWIPENTETVKGLVLVHRHGIGESIKDMEAFKSLCSDMDLAIMSFIDADGLLKGFVDYEQCGQVILNQISVYAESTGHSELETVPLATFGHSNSTAFASRFADWLPERMFAVIAYKSAFAKQIEHDNITNNNIPMLIITGETDLAYGYNDQLYAAERMIEGGGLVQYIQDPNAGHGPNNWMSNTIMFEFLKRAYEAKVTDSGITAADPKTGLYGYGSYTIEETTETLSGYKYKFVPEGYMTYDEYTAKKAADPDFKAQAWLFDKDYAEKWMTFNVSGIIDVDYAWKD